MATKIIKAQITQRHDTLENWERVNPVLLSGELGFVTDDANWHKIGDGVHTWNELPFRGFDDSGKYPNLVAGDLYGHGESVPAEFSFRATGGKSIKDGVAYIKELQGNAVVWNNMVDTRDKVGQSGWTYENEYMHLVKGHIYALLRSIATDTLYCIPIVDDGWKYDYYVAKDSYATIFISQYDSVPSTTLLYSAQDSGACCLVDLTLMYGAGNEPSTLEEYESRKPIVADEYAYNEGEVIAFHGEAVKSVGDNAFNGVWYQGGVSDADGTTNVVQTDNLHTDTFRVIGGETYCSQFEGAGLYIKGFFYDINGAFIGSSNFDVWQGAMEWITPINAHTLRMRLYNGIGDITPSQAPNVMITLVHSGWKVDTDAGYQPYWADTLQIDSRIKEHFPHGMHKWDKVYNKDDKGYIVKGTGVVDLGDLVSRANKDGEFSLNLPTNYKAISSDYDVPSLLTPQYIARSGYDADSMGLDMCLYGRDSWMILRDSRYNDVASIKAAIQDIPLYYELAEPTIIELAEPFKLDYKVADFGTEELIAAQPSAPFRARTIYQFNAVDQIRENYNEIEKIKAALAKAGITID